MTKKECAHEYFVMLNNKPTANTRDEIINEINSLVYEANGEKIVYSDKQEIIDELERLIKNSSDVIRKYGDNSAILELIAEIRNTINEGSE